MDASSKTSATVDGCATSCIKLPLVDQVLIHRKRFRPSICLSLSLLHPSPFPIQPETTPSMSTVLVTGANGFVGVHIVRVLLDRGYTVVGTVRSESKTRHLRKIFNNTEKLKFEIIPDMAPPGAFDAAIKAHEFSAVIHSGSPFALEANDILKDLYEPAIQGTVGLLNSIKAFGRSVKRVIVLSSFASVMDHTKGNWPGHVYSEKDWNPITYEEGLLNGALGYVASKKIAEEAAWEFVEKENPQFTLTTATPPYVYGPPEHEITDLSKLNLSTEELYGYFCGKPPVAEGHGWLWIDVRDLALGLALAIEMPAAVNQRYLITAGRFSLQQFLEILWKYYPERSEAKNVPKPGEHYPPEGTYNVDNSKTVKELGLEFRTFEEMAVDTFKKLEELEKQLAR